MEKCLESSLEKVGRLGVRHYIAQAPEHSGVYRFFDISGKVLYVGKAKSLKNRLQSYLRGGDALPLHIQEMVARAVKVEWLLTSNEVEALFLEAELIEKLHPMYNIQHKDGRSYTYVHLSRSEFPRLSYTRFWSPDTYGPFLSNEHVRNTVDGLYSMFQLRSCTDKVFKGRKKPCMEYDLGRCSAPCVGYVSKEEYEVNVLNFRQMFTAVDNKIIDTWNSALDKAVEEENYETAAVLHKRVQSFTMLRNSVLDKAEVESAELFISASYGEVRCVHICSVRNYIIRHKIVMFSAREESMLEFIVRWGVKNKLAELIYCNEKISVGMDSANGGEVGSDDIGGIGTGEDCGEVAEGGELIKKKYKFRRLTGKVYANLKKIEEEGVRLARAEMDSASRYRSFAQRLGVKALGRVEVYDNSHMGGKWNVGVKIVWTPNGFKHVDYQVFEYKERSHDDYEMMREMFRRRFCKFNSERKSRVDGDGSDGVKRDNSGGVSDVKKGGGVKSMSDEIEMVWPDLIIIDGGVGQLSVASVFIPGSVVHYALSKHEEGDQLHAIVGGKFVLMDIDTDLRLWLMKLRDEAHRFAVASHSRLKEEVC